ncbi:substrate-binding periplasmic protein [Pseudomonas sp. USHLN015]|uniref:substrate-binding periplasmic protein n=1 Tax=Pseudomonas sp. USHLN015 TaxID=3081296 RepID=UPI00301D03A8
MGRGLLVGVLLLGLPWLAMGEELRFGFGTQKPPYVYEGEDRGLELEIVTAAAKAAGFTLQYHYLPMERLHLLLGRGELDGIASTSERSGVQAFYSDVYIQYHNYAIALAGNGYRIDSIADLGKYSVSAFQRARFLLGEEFQRMAENNPRYREEAQQITRNRLLYAGRIDVAIGDKRIINYLNREVVSQVDISQSIIWYDLFPPTDYKVGFVHANQRDRFNKGLQQIRDSGEYRAIEKKYERY